MPVVLLPAVVETRSPHRRMWLLQTSTNKLRNLSCPPRRCSHLWAAVIRLPWLSSIRAKWCWTWAPEWGIDVLLSARRVGATGKAYGLDMTDDMLALARENQRK